MFMFRVMGSMAAMDAPVVFCGANVLRAIQYKYGNPSGLERETHDIDADWVGGVPSMGYLQGFVQEAVRRAGYLDVSVVLYREFAEGRSAGFKFCRAGSVIVKMDMNIKGLNSYGEVYAIGDITFVGQTVVKVVADKLQVVSDKRILRRVKDMIDLYILSYIWRGMNIDALQVYGSMGSFHVFDTDVDGLRHAYGKYNNKCAVLEFGLVYSRVAQFVRGFRGDGVAFWDGQVWKCS